jgi:hypothetical protein
MISLEGREMAATETTKFYDWNGLPAYRDAKGVMVLTHGGGERPVGDLWKFVHEAVPVDRVAFEALKKP